MKNPLLQGSTTYSGYSYKVYNIVASNKVGKTATCHKVAIELIKQGYDVIALDCDLIKPGWTMYPGVPTQRITKYEDLVRFMKIAKNNKKYSGKTLLIVDTMTELAKTFWESEIIPRYGSDIFKKIKKIGPHGATEIQALDLYTSMMSEFLHDCMECFGFVLTTSHIDEKMMAVGGETWVKAGLDYKFTRIKTMVLSMTDANILMTQNKNSDVPFVNKNQKGIEHFGMGMRYNPLLRKVEDGNQLMEHLIKFIPSMLDGKEYEPTEEEVKETSIDVEF